MPETSPIVGITIAAADFRKRSGASIVGVQNEHGLQANPSPEHSFRAGDLLGVLGDSEQRCAARDLIDAESSESGDR